MRIEVLDHGYVRFVEAWGGGDAGIPEAGIVEAARQSTQGSFRGWEPGTDPETGQRHPGDRKLLDRLFNSKPAHATPFEFAGMVIEVQAPIFVFREWHRHRTQAYNEMSARYAPLPDLNYIPTVERVMRGAESTSNKQAGAVKGSEVITVGAAEMFRGDLVRICSEAEALYQIALKSGVPKELARACLPVARYSRMRAATSLRNWFAFLTLRLDPQAQWEIRQYAQAVGAIIAEKFPITWDLFHQGRL